MAKSEKVVQMSRERETKKMVVFTCDDDNTPLTKVYVSKKFVGAAAKLGVVLRLL